VRHPTGRGLPRSRHCRYDGASKDPTTTMKPKDRVVWQEIEGEAVLLDLDSERYFGLNRVGTDVWKGLSAGQSIAGIVDDLLTRFEVPRTQLQQDVDTLIADLRREGLLVEQA
jgi:hypothetical protein